MEAEALKSELSHSNPVEWENLLRAKTNDNAKSTDAVRVKSNYTSEDASKRSHLLLTLIFIARAFPFVTSATFSG